MNPSRIWPKVLRLNPVMNRKIIISLFVFFLLLGSGSSALADSTVLAAIPLAAAPSPNFTFGPPQHYPVGEPPAGIAQGDLNGDGKLDLVTSNTSSANISVLINNGNGTFAPAVNYATSVSAIALVLADLNGDLRPDVVMAHPGLSNISVLLGNGDGTFQNFVTYPTSYDPHAVQVGDFNGDGKPDLAVPNEASSNINILLNNGNGTFQPFIATIVGQNPVNLDKGDFNGDGKLDLAVTFDPLPFNMNSTVLVLLGNGNGTFTTGASYQVGLKPYCVIVADVNGDSKLDLVTANSAIGVGTSNISVLLGNGNGTFQNAVNYPASASGGQVRATDFNKDGYLDLVTSDTVNDRISLLFGNGNGTFQAPVNYPAGHQSQFMAIGDYNGDGVLDLATWDGLGNSATVLLGSILAPPTISKAFGTSNILLNASTTLTFTIHNPNLADSLSQISFTDNMPAGLVVDLGGSLTSTCNGTTNLNGSTITLTGGALAAGASCTISVGVKATTDGTKNNITNPITSTESGTGATSNTATLNVCDPLKVTSTLDNNLCGTLRYATDFLTANPAYSSKIININLSTVPGSITLSGSSLNIPASVTINGVCNSLTKKPDITINGSGIVGPGLTLNGSNTLTGLKVKGFLGSQIHALKGGNKLKCVASTLG